MKGEPMIIIDWEIVFALANVSTIEPMIVATPRTVITANVSTIDMMIVATPDVATPIEDTICLHRFQEVTGTAKEWEDTMSIDLRSDSEEMGNTGAVE